VNYKFLVLTVYIETQSSFLLLVASNVR